MKNNTLAPTKLTDGQVKWMEQEKEKTGNSYSVIVRSLIQEKIDQPQKK